MRRWSVALCMCKCVVCPHSLTTWGMHAMQAAGAFQALGADGGMPPGTGELVVHGTDAGPTVHAPHSVYVRVVTIRSDNITFQMVT